jgi:hypothetical protein
MRRDLVPFLVIALLSLHPRSASAAPKAGDFTYVVRNATLYPGGGVSIAACPAGTRVVGAGGAVSGTNIGLTLVAPTDSNDLGADEDNGVMTEAWNAAAGRRTATAVAICSSGSDAASLTYNRATSSLGSGTSALGSYVQCLGGAAEEALGGGEGTHANAYDRITASGPATSQWAYGFIGQNPDARDVFGFAICLPLASRDVTIVSKTVSIKGGEAKVVRVRCPAGTHVTGGGSAFGGHEMTRSTPFDGADRDRVPDDGWVVRLVNRLGYPNDFDAKAVCAGPVL